MFCRYCGAQLQEGQERCPSCGTLIEWARPAESAQPAQEAPKVTYAPQPAPVTPVYTAQGQQVVSEVTAKEATSALVWGILGLAFACTFFVSFLGIIFSAIGLSRANNFIRTYGAISGKVKTGHILSKVGLIVGIVMTVFFFIWLIVIIAAAGAAVRYGYYY